MYNGAANNKKKFRFRLTRELVRREDSGYKGQSNSVTTTRFCSVSSTCVDDMVKMESFFSVETFGGCFIVIIIFFTRVQSSTGWLDLLIDSLIIDHSLAIQWLWNLFYFVLICIFWLIVINSSQINSTHTHNYKFIV